MFWKCPAGHCPVTSPLTWPHPQIKQQNSRASRTVCEQELPLQYEILNYYVPAKPMLKYHKISQCTGACNAHSSAVQAQLGHVTFTAEQVYQGVTCCNACLNDTIIRAPVDAQADCNLCFCCKCVHQMRRNSEVNSMDGCNVIDMACEACCSTDVCKRPEGGPVRHLLHRRLLARQCSAAAVELCMNSHMSTKGNGYDMLAASACALMMQALQQGSA